MLSDIRDLASAKWNNTRPVGQVLSKCSMFFLKLFLLTPALAALGNVLFFHISEPFIPHPHTLAHHVDATLLIRGAGLGGGGGG